ncbi:MAG: Tat-linked quality control protein TatD [Myxococcota bacterium]|nr:Tat-linked quality control protein TatD [Myxococcota bacterium]
MESATLFDTHCHLDFESYNEDRQQVIDRARAAGVRHMLTIGSGRGIDSASAALEIARREDGIFCSVGLHPHDAAIFNDEVWARLRELSEDDLVVAIGETGLDFFYDNSPRDKQYEAFEKQIALALERDLPIIIHSRDAFEETHRMLREHGKGRLRGVIHCFTYGKQEALSFLDLGFKLSIPGIITFRNADMLREAVKAVPMESLVIETDSPFLAPIPHRGKRNEPSYVRRVAESIAELKKLSVDDVARITTRNGLEMFGLKEAEEAPELVYSIRDSLYLNVTNKCTLACTFCGKWTSYVVKGHYLRLRQDPTAEQLIAAIDDPTRWSEVVFCGYGEPLKRPAVVKQVAGWLRSQGVRRIRINTDGLANLVHGRNVAQELAGLVDCYSISLNAPDAQSYAEICPSKFGEAAWPAVKAFILEAKKYAPEVIASAVGVPGLDMEACRRIAEQELGVTFRHRPYNELG